MNYYSDELLPGTSFSMDVFGPINHLPQNQDKYMLLMVDNTSRYIIATTHKNKEGNTISDQVIHNISYIERQFGRTVKEIIVDKGTEFTNSIPTEELKNKGIILRTTPTQDHGSNRRAERNIRTVMTDVRTILVQSRLQAKF